MAGISSQNQNVDKWNVLAIISICLAPLSFIIVLFSPVSIVLAIIALVQISKSKERGKWLAIWAIIISSILLLLVIIAIIGLVAINFLNPQTYEIISSFR